MSDSDADIGMMTQPETGGCQQHGDGTGRQRSPIMANCAAPETMITDEKTASQGENPARQRQHAVGHAEPGDGEDDESRVPYALAKRRVVEHPGTLTVARPASSHGKVRGTRCTLIQRSSVNSSRAA